MRNLARTATGIGLALIMVWSLASPSAEVSAQDRQVWLGAGVIPGLGVTVVHSTPTLFVLTQEIAVYADYMSGDSDRLLVAAGVGGSVQLSRILEIVNNRPLGRTSIDVGIRLGPSFLYDLGDDTAEEEARSFRVMFDPFARGSYRTGSGRVLFAEVGAHAPNWRAGLSLGF